MAHATPVFREGFAGFEAGLTLANNPYKYGSRKSREWQSGFLTAQDEYISDDVADNLGVESEILFELGITASRFF